MQRKLLTAIAALFVLLLTLSTAVVIAQTGLDPLSVAALLVCGLLIVGVYSAATAPPPSDEDIQTETDREGY